MDKGFFQSLIYRSTVPIFIIVVCVQCVLSTINNILESDEVYIQREKKRRGRRSQGLFSREKTRANCFRKVHEIESRSWERWLGWRLIICKRPVPPDDHLQEARSSRWSFARGRILWMTICKWPVPPKDHLQVARSSGWSFARGQIFWLIIFKRPDPLDDHLQVAGSSGWSFARGRNLWMIICKRPDLPDDYLQVAGSSRWSFARDRILCMIICKRLDPPDDHL